MPTDIECHAVISSRDSTTREREAAAMNLALNASRRTQRLADPLIDAARALLAQVDKPGGTLRSITGSSVKALRDALKPFDPV